MIPSKNTNFVYLSKHITTIEHYSKLWKNLKMELDAENIPYALLENTEDIWVRDYMPVQVNEKHFLQFSFFPEKATTDNHEPAQTNPLKVLNSLSLGTINQSDLIVDGRDIVCFEKKIIINERILFNNSFIKDRKKLCDKLCELLAIKEVVVVPLPRKQGFWRLDNLMRLLNDNTLLISDFSHIRKSWVKDLEKALHETDKLQMTFPVPLQHDGNETGTYSTHGCYLTYVQIGNKILFPIYNNLDDDIAIAEIKKMHPFCKVIPIDCTCLAHEGAGLSSIMWNIKI